MLDIPVNLSFTGTTLVSRHTKGAVLLALICRQIFFPAVKGAFIDV